eukprot:scaffold55051_cov106-Phaeocystis_antarctica.AAC.2
MSLLTVVALVGAAFKVDLRNNMFDGVASGVDGVASGVAAGVACPPQWLPVVLAAGISPQPPAPNESRWSDATPVAEEPSRGRLLSRGSVCPDDVSLRCKGKPGEWTWFSPSKCCKRCAKPGGGAKESDGCKDSSTWGCGCSSIVAPTVLPPPSPPSLPPPTPPPWDLLLCPNSKDFGC